MERRVQMVGSKLNCTQEKQGETGAPMFFFLANFLSMLYYLNTWNRLASYKPWAYTFLKGFLGAYIPGGLKSDVFFLLIGRWAYKWVGVIKGVRGLQCINSSL